MIVDDIVVMLTVIMYVNGMPGKQESIKYGVRNKK